MNEPVCDRCNTPLEIHGDTLAGQGCDLNAAMSDLWRTLLIGIMGERRGWRIWWEQYDRSRISNESKQLSHDLALHGLRQIDPEKL